MSERSNLIWERGPFLSVSGNITGQASNFDIYTYYVRDAQGNVMATYDYKKDPLAGSGSPLLFSLREHALYGSSRLGLRNYEDQDNVGTGSPYDTYAGGGSTYGLALKSGNVSYELGNHLGNVLTVISDRKLPVEDVMNPGNVDHYLPDLLSASDYYPFGDPMPNRQYNSANYRYGFNGKENDNEVKGTGNQQDYGMRIYDPRLGRFLSVDPIAKYFAMLTPYQYASNTPIQAIDIDGLEAVRANDIKGREQTHPKISYTNNWIIAKLIHDFNGKKSSVSFDIQGVSTEGLAQIEYSGFWKKVGYTMSHPSVIGNISSLKDSKNIVGFFDNATGESFTYGFSSQLKSVPDAGDYANTFRHIAWQAISTMLYGEDFAKFVGDAHERDKNGLLSTDYYDSMADLINNMYGRVLGTELAEKYDIKNLTNETAAAMLVIVPQQCQVFA